MYTELSGNQLNKRIVNTITISDGVNIVFDFVPGDEVKVKYGRCQDNHRAVGVIQKVEGIIATIAWKKGIVRGKEWTIDALEYVKKI
ncbi:hypothetical protein JOD82_002021 [Paenibacillus sp. 1182]|uniref:hypothetical protein n=1 Tax=Paenibacillus sp. 1182 TaxID=2806565 RepID=UPI001AEADDAD|nr:hypothetical protein [Paenibacillus sp. 1182]MBP1309001.1 hypothetical protein [Paenibacillus sp. 1182]